MTFWLHQVDRVYKEPTVYLSLFFCLDQVLLSLRKIIPGRQLVKSNNDVITDIFT